MIRRLLSSPCASLAVLVLSACGGGTMEPSFDVSERKPGERAPLTAPCDESDPTRCLLPWPSSVFTVADPGTATGLRVHVDAASLVAPDDLAPMNLADGFSRVTPLVTAFTGDVPALPTVDGAEGPVKLLLAQPGAPGFGQAVPLRFVVHQNEAEAGAVESFVFGYPLRPLAAASDYVAVVTDELPLRGGSAKASPLTQVALGLVPPSTLAEAKLAAYHAPTRAVLSAAGIDPRRVLRVWDFTTRSEKDPQQRLAAMRAGVLAAVRAGQVQVRIDKVTPGSSPAIAAIVVGHLEGLPKYIEPSPGSTLTLDGKGLAVASGTRTAPFRIVLPAGTGSYRFVMFGHGTGGSYDDDTFDREIAQSGAAKVGIQFDGWTGDEVIQTFLGFMKLWNGSHYAGAMLMQAVADAAAVQDMLSGALGDALAAPMLGGAANPAAGRRPDSSQVLWAGGSLGGIMGLVAVCTDPSVRFGVLNVPGAAWTHYVPQSLLFTMISSLLQSPYRSEVNALHALAMSQGIWDEIDGAPWSSALAGRDAAFLVQESIGDPVVPNVGSEMVAVVTGAKQVGAVLVPIAAKIPLATEVEGGSAITQYRVTSKDPYDVHGFAAEDTPAGNAARQQIVDFTSAIWTTGKAKITVPAGCASGSCDFGSPKP